MDALTGTRDLQVVRVKVQIMKKNGRNDEKNNRHSLLFRLFILTNFPDNNIV